MHRQRAVREQATRIALPLLRHRRGTGEEERRTGRSRQPRAELHRRPVVVRAAEWDEDGPGSTLLPPDEQSDVAGRLGQHRGKLLVGGPLRQQLVRGVGEQQLDVELAREPRQLRTRRGCGERGRTRGDAARLERRPALSKPDRRGSERVGVRHEPGEDDHAGRLPHERFGQYEQSFGTRLVGDRDEDRPLRDLRNRGGGRRLQVERRVLPQDRPLELLERLARVDAELLDVDSARVLVGVQGLRLPAGPVQRRHQIPPRPFAERVLGDERLELSDQVGVATQVEVGLDPKLQCGQPDLLEPGDGRLGELLVGDVRERRAPPQRERVAKACRRLRREAAST